MPISVYVNWCDLDYNPLAAALNAISAMQRLKRKLYPEEDSDIHEGVVKLGFSWAGADIMKWTGGGRTSETNDGDSGEVLEAEGDADHCARAGLQQVG